MTTQRTTVDTTLAEFLRRKGEIDARHNEDRQRVRDEYEAATVAERQARDARMAELNTKIHELQEQLNDAQDAYNAATATQQAARDSQLKALQQQRNAEVKAIRN